MSTPCRAYPGSLQRLAGMSPIALHAVLPLTAACRSMPLVCCISDRIVLLRPSRPSCRLSLPRSVTVRRYHLFRYILIFVLSADALAQLLTVPPYAVAAVYLCLSSYVSDRLQSRGTFVAAAGIVGGIGYVCVTLSNWRGKMLELTSGNRLLLAVQDNVHARYFAVFCITSGTYTTIGVVIAWCERCWLCQVGRLLNCRLCSRA